MDSLRLAWRINSIFDYPIKSIGIIIINYELRLLQQTIQGNTS